MQRPRPVLIAIAACIAVFIFAFRREVQPEPDEDKTILPLSKLNENIPRENYVSVVCLGDSHSRHASFEIPPGDVLLHSGDFSMFGRRSDIVAFNDWLGTLPHRHKIVVAGNHDSGRTKSPEIFQALKELLTNALYLVDQTVELSVGDAGKVLRVFGTPWQPQYRGFQSFKSESELGTLWHLMEGGKTPHIVLTHTPAYSILDKDALVQKSIGSTALLKMVADRKPLLHCFGHIHSPGGQTLSVAHSDLNRKDGAKNGRKDNLGIEPGRTLFVNDALATNSLDNSGVYTMRSGAHPISVKIPVQLLQTNEL